MLEEHVVKRSPAMSAIWTSHPKLSQFADAEVYYPPAKHEHPQSHLKLNIVFTYFRYRNEMQFRNYCILKMRDGPLAPIQPAVISVPIQPEFSGLQKHPLHPQHDPTCAVPKQDSAPQPKALSQWGPVTSSPQTPQHCLLQSSQHWYVHIILEEKHHFAKGNGIWSW